MSLQKRKRTETNRQDFNLDCLFCNQWSHKGDIQVHFLHEFFPDEITVMIMSYLHFDDMVAQWAHLKYDIREELYNKYFTTYEKDKEYRLFRY